MRLPLSVVMAAAGFLVALSTSPQESSKDPKTSQAEKPGAIKGRVVAADGGGGLRRARVMLRAVESRQGALPLTAQTDDSGDYEIKEVKSGRYSLMAMRSGYVSQSYGQKSAEIFSMSQQQQGTLLTIRAGETMSQIDFQLIRGGVVEGHIVDQNNEPLSRVMVQLSRFQTFQGKRNLMPSAMPSSTDDRGYFRLFDVPPGNYYLSATYLSFGFQGAGSFPPTYFPGVLSSEEGTKIQVTAGGEVTGIGMALTEMASFSMTGKVLGSDGKPASGVMVIGARETSETVFNSMISGGGRTDTDGSFKLSNLIPGKYRVTARLGREGKTETGSVVLEVSNADVTNVVLSVGRGAEVSGKIVVEGQGQGLDTRQIRVLLISELGGAAFFGGGNPSEVKDDFTFHLDSIAEGPARFNVTLPPGNFYIKAVHLEGRDVGDHVIEFKNNAHYSGIEVVVSSEGAQLNGVVQKDENGEPTKGATVVLFSPRAEKQGKPRFTKTAQTDQQGIFTLRGVFPGEYTVCALLDHEAGSESDPSYLKELEKMGKRVNLTAGATKTENLVAVKAPASE